MKDSDENRIKENEKGKTPSSQGEEANNSKSTNSDKVRKQAEHESGISRGSHVTPNSNSNAGRDI